jgi:1-acyl-sn-glycerol-3-phosphate acyltransferase
MYRMDMIHIGCSQRAQAFNKVVEQGKRLMVQGVWVIMLPQGTRILDALMRQVEAWIEAEMHKLDPEAYLADSAK